MWPPAGTQLPHAVQGAVQASEPSPSTTNTMVPSPVLAAQLNLTVSLQLPSVAGAQRTANELPMGLCTLHIPTKLENGGGHHNWSHGEKSSGTGQWGSLGSISSLP